MAVKVYYLDDEQSLCEIFSEIVNSDDVQVSTFVDANEAIEACSMNPPDILFIDYRLRGTTGDRVASVIDQSIPKVLITGDLNYTSNYKFQQIVSKPCDYKIIAQIIDGYR